MRFTSSVCYRPMLFGVTTIYCLLRRCYPVPCLCRNMGEWVPLMVTEVKLQRFMEQGVMT